MESNATTKEECTVVGAGLERGFKNQHCSFEVYSIYNDLFYLQINIKDPMRGEIPTSVECVKEGTYRVSYKPVSAGELTAEVLWRGNHLVGSPFKVKIEDENQIDDDTGN